MRKHPCAEDTDVYCASDAHTLIVAPQGLAFFIYGVSAAELVVGSYLCRDWCLWLTARRLNAVQVVRIRPRDAVSGILQIDGAGDPQRSQIAFAYSGLQVLYIFFDRGSGLKPFLRIVHWFTGV